MIKTLIVIALATFILFGVQFATLNDGYLATKQLERHNAVLAGHAGKPWQYRILPELLIHPFVAGFGAVTGFKIAFALFVVVAWVALLWYYRALGLSDNASLLGISVLACTFAYSTWDSSLPWSILLEMIFLAIAGAVIMAKEKRLRVVLTPRQLGSRHSRTMPKPTLWVKIPLIILPLTILATLNRETAVFIPLMLFLGAWRGGNLRRISFWAFATFLLVFASLRLWFPPQQQMGWYGGVMPFTWAHIKLNFTHGWAWIRWLWFFGAVPVLVYLSLKRIPPPLRRWLLVIVPEWVLINLGGAFVGEPNKYWTMQAVFLLPAVLKGIRNENTL